MKMSDLMRILKPLSDRIKNLMVRSSVLSSNDSGSFQRLKIQALADEILSDVPRVQDYGLASNPLDGSDAIVIFPSGDRSQGIIIAVDNRQYRVKNLAKGEVCIYTDEGDKIHLKRGNKIEITTGELTVNAATKVIVNAPNSEITSSVGILMTTPLLTVAGLIRCTGLGAGVAAVAGKAKILGDLEATGSVADGTRTMAADRAIYNGHTHPENGTGGGTTSAPNQPM